VAETEVPFPTIAIIGIGLIGSSIARAVREQMPDVRIQAYDISESVRARAGELGLADSVTVDAGEAVR
jgi:cyclohexadieny/prephenate dehydrogenase